MKSIVSYLETLPGKKIILKPNNKTPKSNIILSIFCKSDQVVAFSDVRVLAAL